MGSKPPTCHLKFPFLVSPGSGHENPVSLRGFDARRPKNILRVLILVTGTDYGAWAVRKGGGGVEPGIINRPLGLFVKNVVYLYPKLISGQLKSRYGHQSWSFV